MTNKYLMFAVMVGLLLSACSDSRGAGTRLLINVHADTALASRLQRVTVSVYPADASKRSSGARAHDFKIAHGEPRNGEFTLPFSFGIARGDAENSLLVVEGYENNDVVVERKLIASFEEGITREITVDLTDRCADHVCAELRTTCAPGGQSCVDVDSGAALDAGIPMAGTSTAMKKEDQPIAGSQPGKPPGTGTATAPVVPAAGNAAPSQKDDDSMKMLDKRPSADDADAGPPEPNACEQNNACTNSAYPCIPGQRSGYSCLGQFADWPMPDTLVSSQTKPSYDITSIADVVVDRVTKLEWQRLIPQTYPGCSGNTARPGDTCTWAEAKGYCKELTLAGGGWRLPSKIELESLLGDPTNAPTADFEAFPDLGGGNVFWTVSPMSNNEGYAWTVRSGLGMTLPEDAIMTRNVRCVRAGLIAQGTPSDHYQLDMNDDTVTDTHTQLEWQRKYGDNDTIEDARAYCANLGTGWRLPGLNELLTLVDPTRYEPAIDPVFPAVPLGGMFWTNTPMVALSGNEPQFMAVEFSGGLTGGDKLFRQIEDNVRFTFHARCVR